MTAGDLLNSLSNFESLVSLSPAQFVAATGSTLDACCQVGRFIIILLFIVMLVQKTVNLQIEGMKRDLPKDVVMLILLMAVFGTKTGYTWFATIMMNIYNIFAEYFFSVQMASFKTKMRLLIDTVANSGTNGVDVFNVVSASSMLAWMVSAAIYLLMVSYYMFASVGGFFMLVAIAVGPIMAGFYFFLKTPLQNWLMLVFASIMFPLITGIAVVVINSSPLLLCLIQETGTGSLINILILAIEMVLFMQFVIIFHAGIFGVEFMNVPARIIGVIQFFNGLVHSPFLTEFLIRSTKKKRS